MNACGHHHIGNIGIRGSIRTAASGNRSPRRRPGATVRWARSSAQPAPLSKTG
jgi:sulfite reductase beta subunit-like hemoprotein